MNKQVDIIEGEAQELPQLPPHLVVEAFTEHLCRLNRHDRRALASRLSRKAGQLRRRALTRGAA